MVKVSLLGLAGGLPPRAALARDQSFSSAVSGPVTANGSAFSVTTSGAITGGSACIAYGAITTVTNPGVISGSITGIDRRDA